MSRLLLMTSAGQHIYPNLDTQYIIDGTRAKADLASLKMTDYSFWIRRYFILYNAATGDYDISSNFNWMFPTTPLSIIANNTSPDPYNYAYNINLVDNLSVYKIPLGCKTVDIKLWGAGGGAGGSTNSSIPGYGGAGGYAFVRLTVGVDVFEGNYLYIIPGYAGIGGTSNWYGGSGGSGTGVWVLNKGYSNRNDIASLNANNAVAIAGGGGGGGTNNLYNATVNGIYAGNGGAGGAVNSGNSLIYSGSGTGATQTSHGNGYVAPIVNQILGVFGGGIWSSESIVQEATAAALMGFLLNSVATGSDVTGYVNIGPGGGGGAFCGAPGFSVMDSSPNYTYYVNRGGGGGSSKIYKGTQLDLQSSGISSTPPNSGESGGKGYGGTAKNIPVYNTPSLFSGTAGTPGRVLITFKSQ